jgi:cystathionine beta-lyase/cystathionine gamma-synthase
LLETPNIDPQDELICLGHGEDLEANLGSMSPPIVQTSLFAHPTLEDLDAGLSAEHRRHVYTRGQNPTVEAVESKIARLEHAEAAKCAGSGMGAVSATLFALLEQGSHVLFVNQTYGPTLQMAARLATYGVEHDLVLDLDVASIAAAIKPNTRLIWLESPGTMTLRMLDLAAVSRLAREHDALTVIDNSWATPLFQKPIDHGIDLVVHTASKYLGGHSDVMAGVVCGSEALLERIFYDGYLLLGAALGPMDAWLINRSMRTLPARMRQHHSDGLAVARFLAGHPRVRQVFHPGLSGNGALIAKQLKGFSGLLSFELDAPDHAATARFINALELFRIGVSWGGVESLVLSASRSDEKLPAEGVPARTVRLSVGLEGAAALIADLGQAFSA